MTQDCSECVQIALIKKDIKNLCRKFDEHRDTIEKAVEQIVNANASQWKNLNQLRVEQATIKERTDGMIKIAGAMLIIGAPVIATLVSVFFNLAFK